ncbi:S8 family serine peptidase [Streptococcus sp. DD11]|uniref:S8 family serine peptidase n=1 Tax=Streptococcus sp. DD11 TaxID=1777879 RepID=UPI0010084862|nr:S8 family serine peptidase [Streptococcus sp. DD11]
MQRQRFSLRKYKFGLASVLLGTALVFGAGQAQADEQAAVHSEAAVQQSGLVPQDKADQPSVTAAAPQAAELAAASETASASAVSPAEASSSAAAASAPAGPDTSAKAAESDAAQLPVSAAADSAGEKASPAASEQPAAKAETKAAATEKPVNESKADQPAGEPSSADQAAEKPAVSAADGNEDSLAAEKKASEAQPASISSNEIIKVPQTWSQGYKGQGMVVAVIDSGLDIHHEVLRISDPSKAKYQTEAAIEEAKKKAGIDYGKWYNDKVVFAYNYMDGDDSIKEKDKLSHGMHVTGIAAGNPDKKDGNSEYIYGVAPEAQVMFMRVFSDRSPSTDDAIYVKAIDDAVALGADTINMSLGSTTGSTVNASSSVLAAVERARAKGVSVVIAAGNENTFGSGHSYPLAENPDYGLVGNPSTVAQAISVASVNNTVFTEEVMEVRGLENNAELNKGQFSYKVAETDAEFEKDKEYEYVPSGLGREEDFAGKDLKGKLALIQRGSLSFSEKVNNAIKHGAIGALVYNNVEGIDVSMSLDGDAKKIPAAFISKKYGEALAAGNYKLSFNGTKVNRPHPAAEQMSSFSNWGVTTDGMLKPDVTAPGGEIYSSFNDNTYGTISGTSMAAPHVAGAAALVKEYLLQHYPDLTPEQTTDLLKALIMSTAKIHINKETGAQTSPRQQGAGIVDTAAAVSTGLYVTGDNHYPSVSLGNVGDSFSFDVTVHNITDTDRTLKMIVNTNTDTVKDGYIPLTPRKLTETVWPEITVKAHGSQTVTVKVDASKFAQELLQQMPNGYFLEGFVRFVDPADDGDVVSLPFMGFRGQFQDLPAAEKPIYNLVSDGKSGFYYKMPEDKSLPSGANVTDLETNASDTLYSSGKTVSRSSVVLGTVENEAGLNILQLDADGKVRLAFSPNGDGNKDKIQYRTVLYRNVSNLTAAVYTADDTDYRFPIWQSSKTWNGRKNFYDGKESNPRSYLLSNTAWDGLDSKGEALDDGLYTYVVRYTPDVPGAKEQQVSFNLQIDTQKPLITTGYISSKDGREVFTARKAKDVGNGGILREQLFYLQADEKGQVTYKALDALGNERDYERRVYISANSDGSYTLPQGVDKAAIFYVVEDYAGNKDAIALADLVSDENSGRIRVALVDNDTHKDIDTKFVYRIKDDKGHYVTLDKGKDINFLTFGHYVAEIFTYDKDNIRFYADQTQEFDLTAEDSFKTIEFWAKELVYAPVSVAFDQAVPKNTQVVLKNNNGDVYTLPAEVYGKHSFGKSIATGLYSVFVNLPTGYELWEDEPTVSVEEGKNNLLKLAVVVKTGLLSAVNQQSKLVETAQYYNASAEKRGAYDQAYQTAKEALTGKLSQAQVNDILSKLEAASAGLDGKDSDLAAVKQAIEAYDATTRTGRYANAKEKVRRDYDKAFQAVALLLVQDKVTQAQIDAALAQLTAAEQKLDGKATNFASLKKLVDDEGHYQAISNKFIYASDQIKAAYLDAYAQAKAVLANPGASQEEVKEAIAQLKAAKKKLDGKKPKVAKPKKAKQA